MGIAFVFGLAGLLEALPVEPMTKPLRQWAGAYGAVAEKGEEVVRTDKAWRAAWEKAHAAQSDQPKRPDVDFDKHMVLAVYAGSKSTGGYSIEVTRVALRGNTLVADVTRKEPGPLEPAATVITRPYAFAVVPKAEKVRFRDRAAK